MGREEYGLEMFSVAGSAGGADSLRERERDREGER